MQSLALTHNDDKGHVYHSWFQLRICLMVNRCIGQHSVNSGNYICIILVLLRAHTVFVVIAFLTLKIILS